MWLLLWALLSAPTGPTIRGDLNGDGQATALDALIVLSHTVGKHVSDFCIGRVVYNCSLQSEIPEVECQALVALYDQTNGPGWTTSTEWVSTDTPCRWYGVACRAGSVVGLYLYDNQLSGSIPAELGNLANLNYLELYDNQLAGPIPAELGNLANLYQLHFQANQLSGPIPAELGNLAKLNYLYLYDNQLSGSIPAELGNLVNLMRLRLQANQLSGPIPAELGNLANLNDLALYDNQLSGSIPAELGNLANLNDLTLQANQLSGPVPAELGNLANLYHLILSSNQLNGLVPLPVAELGGQIQTSFGIVICIFVPPGNDGLNMPDTQGYRDADLDGDGYICGVSIGSG